MQATLLNSDKAGKKMKVIVENGNERKTIYFGDVNYSDYTMHKDPKRKELYINRHAANEDWKDPFTAGFWSRWILWNKPSLADSKKATEKMFGIKIK